jgi:hypothetical protein
MLRQLSTDYGYEFMIPILLFYLIGKTETLSKISEHLFRLYNFGNEINLLFLKEKMADTYGDRDVVRRSAGAFIKTLEFFRVIDTVGEKITLKKRLKLNEEQTRIVLQLFGKEIIYTPQISLNNLPFSLFNYFDLPNLATLAQKYNGHYWDYQHRIKELSLILYDY